MNTTREATHKLKFTRIDGDPKLDGDTNGAVTYEVSRDGVVLGKVERIAEASYRSDYRSRIRYGFRGYSRHWRAEVAREHRGGFGGPRDSEGGIVESIDFGGKRHRHLHLTFRGQHLRKRADAAALLVAWIDEPKRRRDWERR